MKDTSWGYFFQPTCVIQSWWKWTIPSGCLFWL